MSQGNDTSPVRSSATWTSTVAAGVVSLVISAGAVTVNTQNACQCGKRNKSEVVAVAGFETNIVAVKRDDERGAQAVERAKAFVAKHPQLSIHDNAHGFIFFDAKSPPTEELLALIRAEYTTVVPGPEARKVINPDHKTH